MKTILSFIIVLLAALFSNSFSQVNFSSSNLPIIVINTNGQEIIDEPKIMADMGIIYNGEGERNNLIDEFNHYNGKIGIEIRGSSSQQFPKKSYAVETRIDEEEDLDVSLLGMPEEADWVLYAPYSDKSLIRNALIYKLSNEINKYTTKSKFVELVLNGEYMGVYVFMEKIKRDKNRVNIKKCESKDTTGTALTGGYLIKIDKRDGANTQGWESSFSPFPGAWQKVFYQYDYPKETNIMPQQINYIQNFIYNFESNMYAGSYKDSFEGYYDIIDIDTFVDYLLLNEFPRNVDAYRLSTFMYKDRDDINPLLKMGPIWDFNLAFGNVNYHDAWNHEGLQLNIPIPEDNFQTPFWWKKLLDDPIFFNKIAKRWSEVKSNVFSKERIFSIVDSLTTHVDEARIRNFQKWNVIGTYVWPNYFIGATYELEVSYLKSWIRYRWDWFDEFFSANYSTIDWKTSQEVEINIDVNEERIVSPQDFFSYTENIDSFQITANDEKLLIIKEDDSFKISSSVSGEYKIKVEGWYLDKRTELSPSYNVSVGVTNVEENALTLEFSLKQNYPNPFNPTTKIKFTLPNVGDENFRPRQTQLIVYDVLGREIKTLINKPLQPGEYEIDFDATGLPSGVYFYRLTSGRFNQTKKMVLLR